MHAKVIDTSYQKAKDRIGVLNQIYDNVWYLFKELKSGELNEEGIP